MLVLPVAPRSSSLLNSDGHWSPGDCSCDLTRALSHGNANLHSVANTLIPGLGSRARVYVDILCFELYLSFI